MEKRNEKMFGNRNPKLTKISNADTQNHDFWIFTKLSLSRQKLLTKFLNMLDQRKV